MVEGIPEEQKESQKNRRSPRRIDRVQEEQKEFKKNRRSFEEQAHRYS